MLSWFFISQLQFVHLKSFCWFGLMFSLPSTTLFSPPLCLFFLPSFSPHPFSLPAILPSFLYDYPPSFFPSGICNIEEDWWLYWHFPLWEAFRAIVSTPSLSWDSQHLFTIIIILHVCTHLWQGCGLACTVLWYKNLCQGAQFSFSSGWLLAPVASVVCNGPIKYLGVLPWSGMASLHLHFVLCISMS